MLFLHMSGKGILPKYIAIQLDQDSIEGFLSKSSVKKNLQRRIAKPGCLAADSAATAVLWSNHLSRKLHLDQVAEGRIQP